MPDPDPVLIPTPNQDLAKPTADLLRKLGLLEAEDVSEPSLIHGTPVSLQVITAGALSVSKWWSGIAGSAGGLGGLTAVLGLWKASDPSIKIALVGGGSVVLATALIAVAVIVRSDVMARGSGTVAQYGERGRVAAAFIAHVRSVAADPLQQAGHGRGPVGLLYAIAAYPGIVAVETDDEETERIVKGFRNTTDKGIQLHLSDGDWVEIGNVVKFTAENPPEIGRDE